MSVRTVGCTASVSCRLSVSVQPDCPVVDEHDRYTVIVEWTPVGETYEKHDLRSTIMSYNNREVTQEQLVESLHDQLTDASVADLQIEAVDTAHMDMAVSKP